MTKEESAKFKLFGAELDLHGGAVRRLGLPLVGGALVIAGIAALLFAVYGKPAEILATQKAQGVALAELKVDMATVKGDVAYMKESQATLIKLLAAANKTKDLALATTPTRE